MSKILGVDIESIILAAVQDTVGAEVMASGSLWRPNSEHELAGRYRSILAELAPKLAKQEAAAYESYCSGTRTTRQSFGIHAVGHGSWVSGPDGYLQAEWHRLKRLHARVLAGSRGEYVK